MTFNLRLPAALGCCLLVGITSCREHEKKADKSVTAAARLVAPELRSNGLGSLPGAIYAAQAKSAIHWQPWSSETMARAKEVNRLIFAVVAMPQYSGFQKVLNTLSSNPALVSNINENYVPVIIDGDASREMGLLTADLCAEIKRGLQLPLLIWLTADGNPVAWIPVAGGPKENVAEIYMQSESMVARMWADDSAYVVKNSAMDNLARYERIAQRRSTTVKSDKPAEDVLKAIRQLLSLYDPYSRSFDEAGGLFPAGALDLLSTAAIHPGLTAEFREKCLETTQNLLKDLLSSAMFDPLEGGVYTSRRGTSWSLPVFNRECIGQARAAVALLNAYRATKNPWALEKALDTIRYAEKNFTTQGGLFSIGVSPDFDTSAWLWSVEEVEKVLTAEDSAWWISLTGMKGLGNLPSEIDPQREFFRTNSIAFRQSLGEMAASDATSAAAFYTRLESVRAALLQARQQKLGETKRDQSAHAGATFRMISAYASAFAATGDVSFRDKSVALLQKARQAFSQGPKLRIFALEAPAAISEGRAFLYALALQATLDVAAIGNDESLLVWAEDLATTAAELFTDSEFLKECPDTARILDLPITDLVMLFDDSTAGLISMAECRLAELQRPLVSTFSELATPLPTFATERPILHTDLLQATLARHFKVAIVGGKDLSPELMLATQRLPLRMIQRRPLTPADDVPAGAVKIIYSATESRLVTRPEELEQAVLPLP